MERQTIQVCIKIRRFRGGREMCDDKRWVSAWGNAVSIAENRPERYAKDITIRYPVMIPFAGKKIRITFDNYCGNEDVILDSVTLKVKNKFYDLKYHGSNKMIIPSEKRIVTDELDVDIESNEKIYISFYLKEFTLMRSVVFTCGPLSEGIYANGNEIYTGEFDIETSRPTHLVYFLSNVSVYTENKNRALVCYGDSITAQDWPDYLQLRCIEEGYNNTSVIRRATSGSRILREYSCLTYESYGLKGSRRFEHEVPTDGADAVLIQQGINDIIHPVGEDVNIYRPMSDLPTVDELIEGFKDYIKSARKMGLKVYAGTLIPMGGWRTDAPFRQEMRNAFNDFIRTTDLIDGCVDFDKALEDPLRPNYFLPEYDSGDHLHPSKAGYKRMAMEVPEELLK